MKKKTHPQWDPHRVALSPYSAQQVQYASKLKYRTQWIFSLETEIMHLHVSNSDPYPYPSCENLPETHQNPIESQPNPIKSQ